MISFNWLKGNGLSSSSSLSWTRSSAKLEACSSRSRIDMAFDIPCCHVVG